VLAYYLLTDPHGNLHTAHQECYRALGVPAEPVFPVLGPLASKVCIAMCMLILQFSMDIAGVDLLLPLNQALSRLFAVLFPIRIRVSDHVKDKLD